MHPIEKEIATNIVNAILSETAPGGKGRTITVYDGEETVIIRSDNAGNILESMGHTEADWLYWNSDNDTGSIMFVYGNSPEEVVADHSSDDFTTGIVETVTDDYPL
jgi:hypothetical protein